MYLPDFNVVDYIALGVILIWTLLGLRQGLTGQIAFLLTAFIILSVAVHSYTPCRDWVFTQFSLPIELARIVALGLVLVVPLAVVLVIYHLMDYILKVTFTKWLDHLGGGLFGMASAVSFVLLALLLLNALPLELRPPGIGQESWIGRHLMGSKEQIAGKIKSRIQAKQAEIGDARAAHTGKREKWEE
jgi:uncharacterized membrane protein required for colicin V production